MQTDSELRVEFTSANGNKFTKIYPATAEVEQFMADKLSEIETLASTFQAIQSLVNTTDTITEGWTFKYNYIAMPADWIEIFVDVITPYQVLPKNYSTQPARTVEFIQNFVNNEKSKLAEWINNNDVEALANYFGQEVTLDGE
jgi:hypothetical protein